MQLYRQEAGVTAQQFRRKALTQPLETLWAMYKDQLNIDHKAIDAALQQELNSIRLFPETIEVLTKLRPSYTLYLISNLATPYIKPYQELKLDRFFEQAIFSCEVGFVKPEQAIFDLIP